MIHPIARTTAYIVGHRRFLVVLLFTVFLFSTLLLLLYRKDADALYHSAMETLSRQRPEEALELLNHVEKDFPDWTGQDDVLYQQGNILLFHLKDSGGALNRWNLLLERFPRSPHQREVRSRMAELYQDELGDLRHALQLWEELIRDCPSCPESDRGRLQSATIYLRTDQLEKALLALRPLSDPGHDPHLQQQAIIRIAGIYNIRKNYQEARSLLEKVVAAPHCDSCRRQAQLSLLDTLELQEDAQKAVEILGRIPDNVLSREEKQLRIQNIRRKAAPAQSNLVPTTVGMRKP